MESRKHLRTAEKWARWKKIEFYYAKLLEKHVCNQMDFQKFH